MLIALLPQAFLLLVKLSIDVLFARIHVNLDPPAADISLVVWACGEETAIRNTGQLHRDAEQMHIAVLQLELQRADADLQ